jgi:NfeD-like C-terminal, partner-binding
MMSAANAVPAPACGGCRARRGGWGLFPRVPPLREAPPRPFPASGREGAHRRCFFDTGIAVAAVPLWRRVARSNSGVSQSNPFLNKRTDALVGRVFTLEKPIIDGSGTVKIDDTVWRVAGPDAPAGSRVKIVQADGASLTVAAA